MDFKYHKVRIDKMWGIAIDYYNGSDTYVKIPPNINGFPVVDINNFAFENRKKVKIISLPKSIKDIGYFAFKNCPNLKIIKIPFNLKDILETSISLSECDVQIQYYNDSDPSQILLKIDKLKKKSKYFFR